MLREVRPSRHASDPVALDLTIPRLVEEEHAHAGLRERLRDDDVVLAERVELKLLRKTHLVISGPRGVVEADAELIALLGRHALEAGNDGVVAGAALPLRQKVPPDLGLIRKLDVELLGKSAEVWDGADRHDIVEVDAELQSIL